MTALEVLKGARLLITDREKWTQGAYARIGRRRVSPKLDADCYDATGAIAHVQGRYRPRWEPDLALAFGMPLDGLIYLNDTLTHAEVLALFDAAIAKLEAR